LNFLRNYFDGPNNYFDGPTKLFSDLI